MLAARLATGTILVVAFAAVLALDEPLSPYYPLWFLATALLNAAAALELVALMRQTSAKPSGNTVFAGAMVMLAANWAPHLAGAAAPSSGPTGLDFEVLAWPMLAFAGVVMAAFVAQSVQYQRPGATVATVAGTVLAVAYVGVLGSFVVQLRWLGGAGHGALPVAFLLATAKGADVGAYTLGRIAGRHKLWPRLSPNKTIEGAVGGLAFAVAAALGVSALAGSTLGAPGLGRGAAVGFGLLVGTAAQLGDLMESMIKRDCERKDASAALPGFGGVLDVVDSLLFAGPVAFGYWLIFGT